MTNCNYLVKSPSGTFHFRYTYQHDSGKRKSFKLSLRTTSSSQARKNALILADQCRNLEINRDPMKAQEELRLLRDHLVNGNNTFTQHQISIIKNTIDQYEKKAEWVKTHLSSLDENIESLTLKDIVELYGKHYEGVSNAIKVTQQQQLEDLHQQIANGLVQPDTQSTIVSHDKPQEQKISVEQAWDLYVDEMQASGQWASASLREYLVGKNTVIQLLPVKFLCEIDKTAIRTLKANLQKLPTNASKTRSLKGLSLLECTQIDHQKPVLSTTSVNKYLNQLKAIISWCINNGYFSGVNPVQGMIIKNKRKTETMRTPFDTEDLKLIFSRLVRPLTKGEKTRNPHKFWLPILSLYTGARINEICQLYLSDIILDDDTPHLSINDDADDKRLKNDHSKRLIPIHNRVLEIGFRDYVSELRSKGEHRLFPKLPKSRDGYGSAPSKFYSREFRKLKLDKNKVFHSFRHTFSNELKNLNVQEAIVSNMMGHSHDSMTFGVYGKTADLAIMKTEIHKLDFKDITDGLAWNN